MRKLKGGGKWNLATALRDCLKKRESTSGLGSLFDDRRLGVGFLALEIRVTTFPIFRFIMLLAHM